MRIFQSNKLNTTLKLFCPPNSEQKQTATNTTSRCAPGPPPRRLNLQRSDKSFGTLSSHKRVLRAKSFISSPQTAMQPQALPCRVVRHQTSVPNPQDRPLHNYISRDLPLETSAPIHNKSLIVIIMATVISTLIIWLLIIFLFNRV